MRQLHIRPFVLARSTADLADLIAERFLKRLLVGFFKEGFHALVSLQITPKIIHQSRNAGALAKSFVDTVIGVGGYGQQAGSHAKSHQNGFHIFPQNAI
jgi:hypothetical protein